MLKRYIGHMGTCVYVYIYIYAVCKCMHYYAFDYAYQTENGPRSFATITGRKQEPEPSPFTSRTWWSTMSPSPRLFATTDSWLFSNPSYPDSWWDPFLPGKKGCEHVLYPGRPKRIILRMISYATNYFREISTPRRNTSDPPRHIIWKLVWHLEAKMKNTCWKTEYWMTTKIISPPHKSSYMMLTPT